MPSALDTRPAAVAGVFYPGDARELALALDQAFAQARAAGSGGTPPKALIVPHAGYVYSGPIAASAYAGLAALRGVVTRVVLLGPAHRVPVRGLALPEAAAFATPLGALRVDAEAVRALAGVPGVVVSAAAHAREHALEVQLPFLQRVLGDVAIVPLVVGHAPVELVADVLERLWGGPETLIVISSDLSHYHPYEEARRIDGATVRAILALDSGLDHERACGATPIAGLVEVARRRGLTPELLDLRNSGDTAGERGRVVGYASFAFRAGEAAADAEGEGQGRTLLRIARGAIREALGAGAAFVTRGAWLEEFGATFVTLRLGGALRGCIGSLAARQPLGRDVADNARAAALRDPRFSPLTREELEAVEIEVSLLSPASSIRFADEADLFAQIVPRRDGVILSAGARRATFLPQVWDELPEPAAFFGHLRRKAGLGPDFPLTRCAVERYAVRKWTEAQEGLRP